LHFALDSIINYQIMFILKNSLVLLFLSYIPIYGLTHEQLNLWPSDAPGDVKGEIGEEEYRYPKPESNDVLRIANVSHPSITVYQASASKLTGTAVIVCPGGGYNILAYEHEGTQVCEWLNELGVTAILLKYRVPRRKNRLPHEAPLQDAQRALGIVRMNAEKWSIAPDRLGILGFSAGGNLAMMTMASFTERNYKKVDLADDFSCRPDFGMLIYPAYLVDRKKRDELFPAISITKESPPCFFVHTGDDQVPAEGSVLAYLALEKAGVSGNELHVYPYGGHGYGMRKLINPVSDWPNRAASWMKVMGLLKLK
jgi:acetyl esterase/lipase